MPYSRPTLTQINASALQDIQNAKLPGVDGLLQRAVLRVLAWALSGLAYEHYGYQDYIARQSVPWTAEDEAQVGWAALKNVQRKPAIASSYQVAFPNSVAGTVLPAGTAMNTPDSLAFSTVGAATVAAGGTVTATILSSGTGTAYNLAVGASISLASSIAGINSTGSVAAVITSATDLETPDAFKARMLQSYAAPPQGGARTDYVEWAEAVPGVSRAWCNPNGAGPGTVVVYPMFDDAEAAAGGFPQGANGVATGDPRAAAATGDQLTVANALFLVQPVTALVYVAAPTALPVAISIYSAVNLSGAVQAAVKQAIAAMFLSLGSPLGITLYPSDFETAISSVVGVGQYSLSAPAAPVAFPIGQIPVLGTVTFTSATGTTILQGTATWDGFTWDDGSLWS